MNRAAALTAAAICAIHAIVMAVFVVYYVVGLISGEGASVVRAIMSTILIALAAFALAALARAWLRGQSWARTPTIVWCVLLLPVAFTMVQAGSLALALAVGGSALIGAVAAARAFR